VGAADPALINKHEVFECSFRPFKNHEVFVFKNSKDNVNLEVLFVNTRKTLYRAIRNRVFLVLLSPRRPRP
jgi:hypothetical protein